MVVKVGFSFPRMKQVDWLNLHVLQVTCLVAFRTLSPFYTDNFFLLLLEHWFLTTVHLSPSILLPCHPLEHLFEDVLGCHNWGEGVTGI